MLPKRLHLPKRLQICKVSRKEKGKRKLRTMEKKYDCNMCGTTLVGKSGMKQHIFVMHNRQYECSFCGKRFGTSCLLKRHVHTHDSKDSFVFKDAMLKRTSDLRKYRHDVNTRDRMYNCSLCGKYFAKKNGVKQHILVMHIREHECEICGKFFGTLSLLRRHKDCHINVKKFECEECGCKFAQKRYVRDHYAISHKHKVKKEETEAYTEKKMEPKMLDIYPTNYGKKNITNKKRSCEGGSSIHPMNVFNEKQTKRGVVETCEQTQVDNQIYFDSNINHRFDEASGSEIFRKEDGLNEYVYKDSGNQFGYNSEKEFDVRKSDCEIISDEVIERDKCTSCGKAYCQARHVRQHILLAHSQKNSCLACGELFATKLTQDKHFCVQCCQEYKCKDCGERFEQNYLLDLHLVMHINDHRYECMECGAFFRRAVQLEYHYTIHAREFSKLEQSKKVKRKVSQRKIQAHRVKELTTEGVCKCLQDIKVPSANVQYGKHTNSHSSQCTVEKCNSVKKNANDVSLVNDIPYKIENETVRNFLNMNLEEYDFLISSTTDLYDHLSDQLFPLDNVCELWHSSYSDAFWDSDVNALLKSIDGD